MNVLAIGTDLVENARIDELVQRHGRHVLDRLFSPAEQAYFATKVKPAPHVAGRFAAKEAILKALGTGWRGSIAWTDMEILNDPNGQPHVTLSGACADIARQKNIARILISISHTDTHAIATALATSPQTPTPKP